MQVKAEQERLLKEAVLAMKEGMPLQTAARLYRVTDVKRLELQNAAHKQGTRLYWWGFVVVLFAFSLRSKLFVSVINVVLSNPVSRKLLWRGTFEYISLAFRDETLFMNYGFLPDEGSPSPERFPMAELQNDQNSANLVSAVLAAANVQSKTGLVALEIGSGRGGGARFIMTNYQKHVSRLTGIDFSSTAVRLCRDRHRDVPGLYFVHGDAERLPLPSAEYDLVLNVESSHCYSNVTAFVAEAFRVLKPGGTFCATDFRAATKMDLFLSELNSQAWASTLVRDITPNVLAALTEDDDRKRHQIARSTPYLLHGLFFEFAGLKGGAVFQGLSSREILYTLFCATK